MLDGGAHCNNINFNLNFLSLKILKTSHFIVSSKKSNFEICLEFQDFHAIFLLLWIKYSKSIYDFKLLNSSLGN